MRSLGFNSKIFVKVLLVLSLFFMINVASAGFFTNLFTTGNPKNPYGQNGYGLNKGIKRVGNTVDDIEQNRKFSEYVQDVVVYLLGFVSVIAIIYMIYGGFVMMLSAGDEEKVKKTKNIITYVIIGIFVMWLAYSIVLWIFDVLLKS